VSFAAITLCIASQRVFIVVVVVVVVYFVTTQSGNFWIHPHMLLCMAVLGNRCRIRTIGQETKAMKILKLVPTVKCEPGTSQTRCA
jgi:hypothetical protein